MDYATIESSGGIQWPFAAGGGIPSDTKRLYGDGCFQTDDGKARLIPTKWEPFPEQPSVDFPLVLNTGRTVEHWHTRTKTGHVPILERLAPRAWLEMNPRDARALHLRPSDSVDVISQRGRVRELELLVTESVAQGQVFVPFHWAEFNANQVTQSIFDPISREPNYKQCAVRVERTAAAALAERRRTERPRRDAR
jgi:assimilatory nitrate reductase catalytic subunit